MHNSTIIRLLQFEIPHIVQIACSEVPDGYNKWTLRLLADKAVELEVISEISHESVRQVLKKM